MVCPELASTPGILTGHNLHLDEALQGRAMAQRNVTSFQSEAIMLNCVLFPAAAILALGGCGANTAGVSSSGTSQGTALGGAEIASLVQGKTFSVRTISGPSAGTVGQAAYDLQARTLSGSFRTPDGETGTYTVPASIQGDRLCQGEGAREECHSIVRDGAGFVKVTETGDIQARWMPAGAPASSMNDSAVPQGAPVSGGQIRSLVEGGPYEVRIFDGEFAGTRGRSNWNFETMRLTGSYRTAEGETGTYDMPFSVEGNQLCSGEDDWKECYAIYPYEGGFMEVTTTGEIHATSAPV